MADARTLEYAQARTVFEDVHVAIYRGDELLHVTTLPDHRAGWCDGFNADYGCIGLEARFVDAAGKVGAV